MIKENSFQCSVTSSEYKSDLTVFSALRNLKKIDPKPLKISMYLIIFQTLICFIFSLLYFIHSANYVNFCFKPTQKGLREVTLQYHLNGIMMLSNVKKEYLFLNMINLSERPEYLEYYQFIEKIYNQSISDVKQVNSRFREKDFDLRFEKLYKERIVNYYDALNYKLQQATHIDFVDKIINNVNRNLPSLTKLNELYNLNYEDSIFLVRNFPSYLMEGAFIYVELMNDFVNSDKEINQKFFILLIVFIALGMILKLYEMFQWQSFMNLVKSLLTIFLRLNENELSTEINRLKEFLKIMKDSNDKYFDYDAVDALRQNANLKEELNKKVHKGSKKGRRALFSKLQGIPKTLVWLYYIVFILIIALYFSFSYYNWTLVDKHIVRLTQTNLIFSNTFIYSSSVVFLEDLIYREKIIRNPDFEKINVTLQTKNGRIQFCKTALDKRMNLIANNSAINIVLDGIDDSRKSSKLNQLITGNLCDLITEKHNFNQKQTLICETMMNGAFKMGLGASISELIKSMKNRELTLQYIPKDATDEKEQQERIKQYIKSREYFDMYLTEILLHDMLEKYYFLSNDFYNEYLEKELFGFYVFLYLSLFFVILLNAFLLYFIKIKIKLIYRSTCRALFFIPYDRMIKDEQLLDFIKKLCRES